MKYKIIGTLVVMLIIATFFSIITNKSVEDGYEEIGDHIDEQESFEIRPGVVVEKIKDGEDIVLLDVRTPEEYSELYLEGSILLPVQEMSQGTLDAAGLDKDEEIIIYCRSGARSKTAYDIMKSLGYTNIKSIAGGMVHWEEDRYPFTESGDYVSKDNINEDNVVGPKLSTNKILHDFGVIPQYGGTVETTFEIGNSGTSTLEIGTLTTSCSCTTASIKDSTIEPGETTTLTVVFDPDFHEEPLDEFKRTVFIPTNDVNNPESEVSITVDINEDK